MSMNMSMNMNMNMNTEGAMTTITMRPQKGAGGSCGEEELQPAEFCVSGGVADKLSRSAAFEQVTVPVFFRSLIRAGPSRCEYQGGL